MISQIVHIFFTIVFAYLSVNILYLLFVSIAGLFKISRNVGNGNGKPNRFAVLITSYKEDEVIVKTVEAAVQHDYPSSSFDVFVAADHLRPETISLLSSHRSYIHEVNFTQGSKARSLNYLLNKIDESKYDIALILDGDNIMLPGFLKKINDVMHSAGIAAQGHRTAKNVNTPIAILDAISEEVNNHLFRKAPAVLGMSSSLIGSGMAFPFKIIKQIYNKPGILDNPACDREVDFEMLVHDIKVIYANDAILLDEKVSSKNVYRNQRRRWLESQLMHIKLFFSDWKRIYRKTPDFWNKLFIQLIPPRILLLGTFVLIFTILAIGYIFNYNATGIPLHYWIILLGIYILSLFIAIPKRFFTAKTLQAFLSLPTLLISFIRAAFTIRANRKEFVHTPKSYTGNSASTEKEQ